MRRIAGPSIDGPASKLKVKEKTDINSRTDIDQLMVDFYTRAMGDPMIGYLFTEVAKLDLDVHLPVIGDFWETMLFRSGNYTRHGRNPLQVHAALDDLSPLQPEHFERWLEIFAEVVDARFSGPRADFIKMRAQAIASRFSAYLRSPVYT